MSSVADCLGNEGEECRTFALFTASIGTLVPSTTETLTGMQVPVPVIQTAQGLRDDHALRRLQRLCEPHHNHHYDTFIIRGPYNFAASMEEDDVWYQRITLSATVATAIVDSLEKTSTQWKHVQIWHAHVNGPLLQVLDSAKRKCVFQSMELRKFDDPVMATYPILSAFALENPKLTRLKLHGVAIDLPCLDLLKRILATTSVSLMNSEGATNAHDVPGHKTHLTCLEIRNADSRLREGQLHVLSSGLRFNHTLRNLSLLHADFDLSFSDALLGQPTLEILNLTGGRFTEATILGIGKVLQHPSCHIKSLFLDECEILTSSRFIGPLRIDVVANALANGTCSSLISLSLQQNTASSRDLQRLMTTVHACCPNLQEVDLTQNRVERIIWNHNDVVLFPPTHASTNETLLSLQDEYNNTGGDSSGGSSTISSTTTHKTCALQRLFLNRNPIIHNRFRARSTTDNHKLEELLLDFPGLGQIVKHDKIHTRFLPFSPKVHMLLSFNRVTRGQLGHGHLPIALWYHVLARIPILLEREAKEMSCPTTTTTRTTPNHHATRHARACQASVLFLLLNRHPSQVTQEACRMVQEETSSMLILPVESTHKNAMSSPTARPKRRKIA